MFRFCPLPWLCFKRASSGCPGHLHTPDLNSRLATCQLLLLASVTQEAGSPVLPVTHPEVLKPCLTVQLRDVPGRWFTMPRRFTPNAAQRSCRVCAAATVGWAKALAVRSAAVPTTFLPVSDQKPAGRVCPLVTVLLCRLSGAEVACGCPSPLRPLHGLQ